MVEAEETKYRKKDREIERDRDKEIERGSSTEQFMSRVLRAFINVRI